MVSRIFVEKKSGFDVEAQQLLTELRDILGIDRLENLRLINRYDVEGISEELFEQCIPTVFSEPQVDISYRDITAEIEGCAAAFPVEYLPGQFDQRADSASECIQLISQGERPTVRSAKVYVLYGVLRRADLPAIMNYVINPVEARAATMELPETLQLDYEEPADVEVLEGFDALDEAGLAAFIEERGLAMDLADIRMFQDYFRSEGRPPTITEVKMVDTYWSDHCRHTTFGTELTSVQIDDEVVREAFDRYLAIRRELGREDKPVCLMDMGTIGAKYLKARGIMTGLDESEEINACTVKVKVDVNGVDEDWLFLFKNETHNHPTEIEPFGGAATCVGGAIRDPLSGRSYVYQAMRVTGAADPTVPVSETIPGKLPQRKLVTTAAAGYSSYGNQIGLATGIVDELYHPGYAAKRMEIGAVLGATPQSHVRREEPAPGDVVVLLGGRTGRDGIGGATGSSKAHKVESLETCGAEVQKGNPPVERKIQRLFRRGDACRLIKRCNDFGAGGVSVAIGELADGLFIELDKVPKKYDGLDGTELTISESQERMAVALAPEDVDEFLCYAREENLEATPVATVTDDARVRMVWRGQTIVDVSREFLASNGAPKSQDVHVLAGDAQAALPKGENFTERLYNCVTDLNNCSRKGLVERFDSTIGAATVLMPFGGKTQLSPAQAMVAKFPVLGKTTSVSGMAWGYNPYITSADTYTGAYLAVAESVAKLIATGFKRETMYLTLQEYFEKLRDVPERWGKPTAAVLGALMAQVDLGVGAIGGKDSMSGSFEDLDVPPTLVSFAVGTGHTDDIISPEFKQAGSQVILVAPRYDAGSLRPNAASLVQVFDAVQEAIASGKVLAAATCGYGGLADTLFKMCVGNQLGLSLPAIANGDMLFMQSYGAFVLELDANATIPAVLATVNMAPLGQTTEEYTWQVAGESIDLAPLQEAWERPLEGVFSYRGEGSVMKPVPAYEPEQKLHHTPSITRPEVVIPVFPGNNCEYDSAAAFERAGAVAETFIVNNLTPAAVAESTSELAKRIAKAQILMIPGGFSGGDEPDGSAKFITSFFRAPEVTEAVRQLLANDGLILGICNGFQALVKLGLVPFGDIIETDATCPTLTFNTIGRHQSKMVRTRVGSTLSPWLSKCAVGDIHSVPISHGEGRFVASETLLLQMAQAGQIATQYVDADGNPSMDMDANPNGSIWAIEGITSPDGRILGKMGHTERAGAGLYKNIPDYVYQPLIEGGVAYFAG
ncbi:MAG: phosphoribosylformylglycinamidine synthase [Eggerthellaceae bacterium]|nr:phosphoribosylformylglycinamidine synthase [Eggerthellaceae bacterium]